jgi:Tol biopolymer transport system component
VRPGSRLGHYAIVAPLGAGGMGEVFRATDTRLGRDVALKRLPEAFASDPERLARFEREAKLLAALSHPNVATLFGLEQIEGQRVLAMELVPGEDLAERLRRGPLPVEEALRAGRQIAEALEAAHEKGIVHRDLKPANIKLVPDGSVKVLDFGLAKAWSGDDATTGREPGLSQSPTLAHTGTAAGVILGTAAYMSPEQARGKAVDRRADIWAFGVVLFEMLSGRRLFDGDTVSDVLAAVLTREPDFAALPPGTPASVSDLLHRCLVREPRNRLQSIGDARIALQDAELTGASLRLSGVARSQAAAAGRSLFLSRLPWAVALALAVALVVVWRRPLPAPDVISATIPAPPGTGFDVRGRGPGPAALSPDGSRVAFAAQERDRATQLYVRALVDGRVTGYPGSEGAQFPFWSPDGRWIAFFSRSDGTLKRVPVEGGAPLTICRSLNGKGGSWGRDDVIVLAPSAGTALFRVPAAGGEPQPVTQLSDRFNSHRHPRFLPDGRRFLFLARAPRDENAVFLGSLDGTPPREVLRSVGQAEYASGQLVFVRESVLMAQPFDLARGAVTGEARPLADGVMEIKAAAFAAFSTSATGRIVFHSGETQAAVRIELRDRKGTVVETVGPPGFYRSPTFSPDGRRIATGGYAAGSSDNYDVWLFERGRESATRLTSEPTEETEGAWTPDGRTIYYATNPNGPHDIYRKSVGGSGQAEPVVVAPGLQKPSSVSPDGRYLLFNSEENERNVMKLLDLGSGRVQALREGPFSSGYGVVSPDGRWLAFESDETGHEEVFVTTFPQPGRTWAVSTDGGRYPAWRADGREIVYAALDGRVMAVTLTMGTEGIQVGTAIELFRTVAPQRDYPDWHMSPDGQRFAVVPTGVLEARNELRLIVNWPARLGSR